MLERRELHLTAICEVREFLCDQNHEQLLAEISGKTKLQIREILARRFPQADIPASMKKLPALEPLAPGRYRLLLTLSAEQKAKLELARDLLSHANPTGDLAVVLERALDELVSRLESRRFGGSRVQPIRADALNTQRDAGGRCADVRGAKPQDARVLHEARDDSGDPSKTIARRKHIPRDARRQVRERDGVCCAFVSADGRRCAARAFLQFHHRHAWARGGPDTIDNLALFCHAHNRLLVERDFGRARIDAAILQRNAARSSNAVSSSSADRIQPAKGRGLDLG